MTIALLHAYRAANRGDGWLVELSRSLVREATGTEPEIYALDPAGMGPGAQPVFPGRTRLRAGTTAALATVGATSLVARTMTLPEPGQITAALGMGGGYLRCSDPVHELVFRAHHLPQLDLIAGLGQRGAYLPVSVGPFRRGLGRAVRARLARTAWVAARDDRSARYLGGWAPVQRFPDLAACHLGRTRPEPAAGTAGIVAVVFRSLERSDLGFETVAGLERRGLSIRYGVQSSQGRTNDDRSFYADRGVLGEADDFGRVLAAEPRPSVALAGRLHAALEAISVGIPTVHLGYERKSAGAFADLGLDDYVVDAWRSDPEQVADLVASVADDPEPYWQRLSARFDTLDAAWSSLTERVGALGDAT